MVDHTVIGHLAAQIDALERGEVAAVCRAAKTRVGIRDLLLTDLDRAWTHAFLDRVVHCLEMVPPDIDGAYVALGRAREFWIHPEYYKRLPDGRPRRRA